MSQSPHPAPPGEPPQAADMLLSGDSIAGRLVGSEPTERAAMSGAHPAISGRLRFAPDELLIVMSHYDIGLIEAVHEYRRGSRKAPKILLESSTGAYLLKRRARGRNHPFQVAFCHAVQLYLGGRGFPVPALIGTRDSHNSMLQHGEDVYELFQYVQGSRYDQSLEQTTEAGKVLAQMHKLVAGYRPEYDSPRGSYHDSSGVIKAAHAIPERLRATDGESSDSSGGQSEQLVQWVEQAYLDAAKRVRSHGFDDWPRQLIHCDWHPGNIIYRNQHIAAVVDFDAARIAQRIIDVANGALQFSMVTGGEEPGDWPDYLDETRFKRFLRGYDGVPGCVISRAELRVIPWLMIEALLAEVVIPIGATGMFARMPGRSCLEMVQRKVRWIQDHVDELVQALDGG